MLEKDGEHNCSKGSIAALLFTALLEGGLGICFSVLRRPGPSRKEEEREEEGTQQ
jgi:hypothetical protein